MTWGVDYASVDDGGTAAGAPDLGKLKSAGCEFVWLRSTYICAIDHSFVRDWAALARAGLVRGAYMFPVLGSKFTAEQQVAAFAGVVRAAGGLRAGVDLPPCIDVEFPGRGVAVTGLDRAGVLRWLKTAVAALHTAFGVWPFIYTSGRVWNDTDTDCLGNPTADELVSCPLWLARYAYKTRIPAVLPPPVTAALPVPHPWGDTWFAHQDQGDALGVPGLKATADVDRFRTAVRGDRGGHIAYVQAKLGLTADGAFGPATEAATRAYQTGHGLSVTGAFDLATFCSLAWR
jgi:peptidoglycan hydrolase-like protein with peptidoglycan-binding domain